MFIEAGAGAGTGAEVAAVIELPLEIISASSLSCFPRAPRRGSEDVRMFDSTAIWLCGSGVSGGSVNLTLLVEDVNSPLTIGDFRFWRRGVAALGISDAVDCV